MSRAGSGRRVVMAGILLIGALGMSTVATGCAQSRTAATSSSTTGASSPAQAAKETQQATQTPTPTQDSGEFREETGDGGSQQEEQAQRDLPDILSRTMVQSTIHGHRSEIGECVSNNPEGVTGNLMIRFVVEGSGSVSSASALGDFSGTTVGRCLEGVVRGMRFPETRDDTRTINYPFPVR